MRHTITTFLLALAVAVGVAGCNTDDAKGYAVNAAAIAKSGVELNSSYDAVAAVVASDMESYTEAERASLKRLDSAIADLLAGIDRFEPDGAETIVAIDDLQTLYGDARTAYIEARAILEPRLDDKKPDQRLALEKWDARALLLDSAVQQLLQTPDGRDISGTVSTALRIASTGVRLAVSAGVL